MISATLNHINVMFGSDNDETNSTICFDFASAFQRYNSHCDTTILPNFLAVGNFFIEGHPMISGGMAPLAR